MTMVAEIGVTCLQANGHQELPTPNKSWEERKDTPLGSLEEAWPCQQLDF